MAGGSRTVEFEVPEHLSGLRLDQVLSALAGISRAKAASLIKEGKAGVANKARVAPSLRLSVGDRAFAELEDSDVGVHPIEMDLEVLHEDEHVGVVSKPAGIPVHPASSVSGPTLVSGLLARWPQITAVGEPDRPGIVHRLDQDVSGLMVVALDPEAYAFLVSAFSSKKVTRKYLALAAGVLEADTGRIEGPIGRDPHDPTKRAVVLGGKPAATNYTRLAYWEECSLAEVELDTGRTHQIRVHMQAIGHPLCGDSIYGRRNSRNHRVAIPKAMSYLERPFLHAYRLEFEHPFTKEWLVFESALPPDLVSALFALGTPVFGSLEGVAI